MSRGISLSPFPRDADHVFVTGLVLAAGGSRRLGRPKQLLPFRGTTLLGASLDMARACGFDQVLATVGGSSDLVRARVSFAGVDVIDNRVFGTGCSSSISAALPAVDRRSCGIVLLLGDQPGIRPDHVHALIAGAGASPLGICRYGDGPGHPFWFGRPVFDDLAGLHGDKGVWRLLESGRYPVTEVAVDGPAPLDVDTEQDYESLLARENAAPAR